MRTILKKPDERINQPIARPNQQQPVLLRDSSFTQTFIFTHHNQL